MTSRPGGRKGVAFPLYVLGRRKTGKKSSGPDEETGVPPRPKTGRLGGGVLLGLFYRFFLNLRCADKRPEQGVGLIGPGF